MNYRFHTTVHARGTDVPMGPAQAWPGLTLPTLAVTPPQVQQPFAVSFERTIAAFEKLPRMFCEPDGSFVWVSAQARTTWQVDGNLFDRDGRLVFVDLRGLCPAEEFDRLLTALGWPATPLMFQMVREAVFLGEAEFRQLAAAQALVA